MCIVGPNSRQPRACVQRALLQAQGERQPRVGREGGDAWRSAASRQASAGGREPFPGCSGRKTSVGLRTEKHRASGLSWLLGGNQRKVPGLRRGLQARELGCPGPSRPCTGVAVASVSTWTAGLSRRGLLPPRRQGCELPEARASPPASAAAPHAWLTGDGMTARRHPAPGGSVFWVLGPPCLQSCASLSSRTLPRCSCPPAVSWRSTVWPCPWTGPRGAPAGKGCWGGGRSSLGSAGESEPPAPASLLLLASEGHRQCWPAETRAPALSGRRDTVPVKGS